MESMGRGMILSLWKDLPKYYRFLFDFSGSGPSKIRTEVKETVEVTIKIVSLLQKSRRGY